MLLKELNKKKEKLILKSYKQVNKLEILKMLFNIMIFIIGQEIEMMVLNLNIGNICLNINYLKILIAGQKNI